MLYTVRPLERVYYDMNEEARQNEVAYKEFETEYGKVMAEEVDGNYVIRNVISTNMADYLDEKYKIGSIYHSY